MYRRSFGSNRCAAALSKRQLFKVGLGQLLAEQFVPDSDVQEKAFAWAVACADLLFLHQPDGHI